MKAYSEKWKSSTSPRKQHKYRYNAPLHVRQNLMSVHLSKDLRKKYGRRSITVRKGDTVKILRGQFRNKSGNVESVDLKKLKIFIAGVDRQKRDGSKARYPLEPSNIMITDLSLEDKKRQKSIEEKRSK